MAAQHAALCPHFRARRNDDKRYECPLCGRMCNPSVHKGDIANVPQHASLHARVERAIDPEDIQALANLGAGTRIGQLLSEQEADGDFHAHRVLALALACRELLGDSTDAQTP